MDLALTITFWTAAGLLFHTFAGYPAIVHFLGRLRGASASPSAGAPPPAGHAACVSVVMVIRNEAGRIEDRIRNLYETDHPVEQLEIIVVSDGSTDDSITRIRSLAEHPVHLIEYDNHRGKPSGINEGVEAASGEIIVFADARQRFTPGTIPSLVAMFSDPLVGAVSGELLINDSKAGVGAGVDAYWRLEKAIRLGESRIDSAIGCTGAIYAIRKEHFEPFPPDTILDDVVCPMKIALCGKRVLFQPEAVAFDPQQLDPSTEKRRKRRTLAGNFQMLFRYPCWLLPWKNRLVLQLISHKYLRLAAPPLLLLALASGVILACRGSCFFTFATAAQCAFYLLAAAGMACPHTSARLLSIPAAFTFLNLMTVRGLIDYLSRRHKTGW